MKFLSRVQRWRARLHARRASGRALLHASGRALLHASAAEDTRRDMDSGRTQFGCGGRGGGCGYARNCVGVERAMIGVVGVGEFSLHGMLAFAENVQEPLQPHID